MTDLRPASLRLIEPDFVDRVPAPAYDLMGPLERQARLEANPDSYLAVTRSQEDDPASTPADILRQSRAALDRLLRMGAFGPRQRDRLFLYRLEVEDHSQTGIVAELAVEAVRRRRLKPHEQIFPERAELLAEHLQVVGAQSSPIAVAHAPLPELARLVASITQTHPPLLDFRGADGLRQTIWSFPHPEALGLLGDRPLYLLDGHHRAAAAQAHADRTAAGPADPASWLLATLFPTDSLRIYGFDRRVLDPRHSTDECLARIGHEVALEPIDRAFRPTLGTELGVYAAGRWYRATLEPLAEGALSRLAPVLLQARVLEPVFGIVDPQSDYRLDHLPAARDAAALAADTDDNGGVLFTLAPITAEQLMTVADEGQVLPPKSTFLTPKVRSGLFLRELTG